ncbi:MAG: VCBS repeat-containing protein [Phyllobacteriaceae bacterium]|nr:VCBS repeat-containing protein [Phyllobacteriaceae bacterium]
MKAIAASLILFTLTNLAQAGAQTGPQAERLPDGEVTRLGGWSAWLTGPTNRYAHGALGDRIEASGFAASHAGKTYTFELDDSHVFEDRRVRLVELDGDPSPECVIIRASQTGGAAIAIYDIGPDGISLKAETPDIGRPNRWLNIAGFGDFTGRGTTEIAAVVTPHIAGSLRIYEVVGRRIIERARIDGYTNHINGTRDLDLAQIADVNGDGVLDIALPRIKDGSPAVVTFAGGKAREL